VKIAISTNEITNYSQAIARVLIPEDINKMVENLNEYRKTLKDFEEKVQNEITE
jgi:precorrin-2 dehydrogenase/sirohydrochlorin ferrochelatase